LQAARDDPLAEDSPSEAEEPRAPRGRGRVVESVDLDAIALDAARDASGSGSDDGSGGSDVDDGAGGAAGGPREYRERPERRRGLPELLAAAGYAGPAAAAPDLDILDIVSCNSDSGGPGSLFVCVPCEETGEDGHDWADQASELGAVAVLAGRPLPGCLLPVVVLPDLPRALGAVAAEFFGEGSPASKRAAPLPCLLPAARANARPRSPLTPAAPTRPAPPRADSPSTRLRTVALVGSYGKTTTAWLARGLLEEGGQLVGMSGNTEHALGEDRLTREGHLWVPDEEDTTLDRDCAAPFHAAPYAGKYELPGTTPDALHLQKLLAGMADRGAGAAVVEVCPTLAADGRADALRPEVLVFTNVAPERAAADPGGADAYVERIAAMFERLQPDQTAVINVDGAPRAHPARRRHVQPARAPHLFVDCLSRIPCPTSTPAQTPTAPCWPGWPPTPAPRCSPSRRGPAPRRPTCRPRRSRPPPGRRRFWCAPPWGGWRSSCPWWAASTWATCWRRWAWGWRWA
jgi:hypothetical protein